MINLVGCLCSLALLVATFPGCGDQAPDYVKTRDGVYIIVVQSLKEAPDRCDAARDHWPDRARAVLIYADNRPIARCEAP